MSYVGSGYLSYTMMFTATCTYCEEESMRDCFVDDMGDVEEEFICNNVSCRQSYTFRTEV